jgi:hypothetical protein
MYCIDLVSNRLQRGIFVMANLNKRNSWILVRKQQGADMETLIVTRILDLPCPNVQKNES